jgi:hypothetical protein
MRINAISLDGCILFYEKGIGVCVCVSFVIDKNNGTSCTAMWLKKNAKIPETLPVSCQTFTTTVATRSTLYQLQYSVVYVELVGGTYYYYTS